VYSTHLEKEDQELLRNAIAKLHQKKFTKQVMKELLNPEEEEEEDSILLRDFWPPKT
jgi:hemerythrin-like domain-containing protein